MSVFKVGFQNDVSIHATSSDGRSSTSRVSFEDDIFRVAIITKIPEWSYERE